MLDRWQDVFAFAFLISLGDMVACNQAGNPWLGLFFFVVVVVVHHDQVCFIHSVQIISMGLFLTSLFL